MDDDEFIRRMKRRIQQSGGFTVELEVDHQNPRNVAVDFSESMPRVVFGADALEYPGMARMFMQHAILCLREHRQVDEQEFLLFLRRN